MVLTLEIKGPLAEKLGSSASKVFNAVGGSIGRLPDNSWPLPDPYISGHHALIKYVDGVFYIEDTSTNGVFVNRQDNRLVKGEPYAIKSGDWIFIEPYEIKASISKNKDSLWQPFDQAEGMTAGGLELDPMALLEPNPARARRASPKASDLAGKPVISEHYAPPKPLVAESASAPGGPEPLIPDDYDPLITEDHSGRMLSSRSVAGNDSSVPYAPARQPMGRPLVPRSGPPDAPDGRPLSSDARPEPQGVDLQAVLAGAGLEGVVVSHELARDFGEILRVVVGGVMEVLQARQQLKSEFRMGMTTFKPADNNPLKFSANVDDALHNLLVKRNPAYLGPVEAFEDALDDVKNHHIAMLAGVRVAFESMLAEFDPERLQADFDRQLKKGALLSVPAKLRYWDLYREKIHDMVRDVESTFRKLFGDEFARAYEEQLKRLKGQVRVPRR